MKPWQLDRRVGSLSDRLRDLPSEGVRIDFDTFPEPEKQLLKKVRAMNDKYAPGEPPEQVLEENAELIFKAFISSIVSLPSRFALIRNNLLSS